MFFKDTSTTGFNYSFILSNISVSGFTLQTSYLNSSRYRTIVLAYMTIINNYGIELTLINFASVFSTTINGTTKQYTWQTNVTVSSNQNYLVSAYLNTI